LALLVAIRRAVYEGVSQRQAFTEEKKKRGVPNKPAGAWKGEIRKRGQPGITRGFRSKALGACDRGVTRCRMYVDTVAADTTTFVEVLHQYMEKQAIHN